MFKGTEAALKKHVQELRKKSEQLTEEADKLQVKVEKSKRTLSDAILKEEYLRNEWTFLKMNADLVKKQMRNRSQNLHEKAIDDLYALANKAKYAYEEALVEAKNLEKVKKEIEKECEEGEKAAKEMTIDLILAQGENKTFKKAHQLYHY